MKKALTLFRGTVKVLLVVALFVGAGASAYAQEADSANTAVPRPRTAKRASGEPSGSASTGSIKSLKRDMSALHDQFKSLIEEVSALQDRVTGLQTGLDTLDASRRLRDLEKAISDLNGKGSSTTNVAEESKSQVLDLGRKLKSQQDILDQLRDQVDRLQQALIQKNTRQEAAPPVEGEKK